MDDAFMLIALVLPWLVVGGVAVGLVLDRREDRALLSRTLFHLGARSATDAAQAENLRDYQKEALRQAAADFDSAEPPQPKSVPAETFETADGTKWESRWKGGTEYIYDPVTKQELEVIL